MQAGRCTRFFAFWRAVLSEIATPPSSSRNHTSDSWRPPVGTERRQRGELALQEVEVALRDRIHDSVVPRSGVTEGARLTSRVRGNATRPAVCRAWPTRSATPTRETGGVSRLLEREPLPEAPPRQAAPAGGQDWVWSASPCDREPHPEAPPRLPGASRRPGLGVVRVPCERGNAPRGAGAAPGGGGGAPGGASYASGSPARRTLGTGPARRRAPA